MTKPTLTRPTLTTILIVLSFLGSPTPMMAQQTPAQEPAALLDGEPTAEEAAAVPMNGPTSPEELEAFIDGVMAAHMPSHDLPAATVSVVKDGALFFAKGYGWADREKRIPVDPEKTLFRPGSISKLFTWTAVMQLVEQGKLDLDADVNGYLESFQIPDTYPEPVTMTHLLTHTPGFEDGGLGYLFIKSAAEIVPLNESLKAHIPARVRPPGTYSSYSNFGTALAGLIVANISGVAFNEYIEKNIFEPLGMANSTFREPLPEHLAPDMAVGYKYEQGLYKAEGFEFVSNFGPAGALSSSATDMARFMIAHLQLGRYGDSRILREETARRMHSQLYTLDPRLPGMAHGFYEWEVHGHRTIGHGGDTIYFHSNLTLLPDHDVGLYVSYVTGGGQARIQLLEAFIERYFEVPEKPEMTPPDDFQERGKKYAGSYRFTRHNYSQLEKALALGSVWEATPRSNNTLMTTGLFEDPQYWVEVEPGFFHEIDGWQTLAFKEGENGEITHMFLSLLPFMPAYRISWYQTPGFNLTLLGLGGLFFVTTLWGAFRHRKKRKESSPRERWAIGLADVISALTLIFVAGTVVIVSSLGADIFYGIPPSLTAALVLPIVTTVLTLAVPVFLVLAWKDRYWTVGRRIHFTLFGIFAIGYVWFYYYWNILGFQY